MSSWLSTLRLRRLPAVGAALVLLLAAWVAWGLLVPHPDPLANAIRKRGYPTNLAELEAWYPAVPPAENVALVYTNALALLTNAAESSPGFTSKTWLPPVGQRLSGADREELTESLATNQVALRLLYSAPATGRSHYPIRFQDGFNMLLPHLGKMKYAVQLLSAEGLMHASDGDAEKATQAFVTAGRLANSLAEEPVTISQLVRYALWAVLLPRLERALSLISFTDTQLTALQRVVEAAERPQAMARSLAGEQVCGLTVFSDARAAQAVLQGFQNTSTRRTMEDFAHSAAITAYRVTGLLQRDKSFYCDAMGKYIAAVELSYPARMAAGQRVGGQISVPNRFCIFSRMLLPALSRLQIRDAEHAALVRVATVTLAVERFRLAHANRLPENLEQLTPSCCQTVPTDPIDGKPLRYKTHGDSYAVYSIGTDGQDDGGVDWDSNYLKIPQDVSLVVKH